MSREVRLNHLDEVLAEFEYPMSQDEAAKAGADVKLQLADGSANLGEVIEESDAGRFTSAEDLNSEVMNHLPRRAVGEPYQSEGDA